MRVLVPVGKERTTGYITELTDKPSGGRALRPIEEILDDEPLVVPQISALTRWAADYYLTSWGEMIKAALPAGINVDEKQVIRLSAAGREELKRLRELELIDDELGAARDLLDHLAEVGWERIGLMQKRFSSVLIGGLLGRGLLEHAVSRTGRRLEKLIKAVALVDDPPQVEETFWTRSPKRREAFERLREVAGPVFVSEVREKLGVSQAVVDGLGCEAFCSPRSHG